MSTLTISKLSKTYSNGVRALDNVSLSISDGMFGLLGPNGAGKSSLMRTIATLQEPDSGSVFLENLNVIQNKHEVRKILGYLPQEFGLYPKISAETLLNHFAILKGIALKSERKELVKSLLQKTNLYEHRDKNLGGYSGGMKQRFGIAQALISSPKLIIVDEPTAGLDPAERNRFLNLLSEIGERAVVILSTHIVDDVKELCSDLAIINQGKVLMQATPAVALESLEDQVWSKSIEKEELEEYKSNFNVISERRVEGRPIIHVVCNRRPDGFDPKPVDLEDVYFSKIKSTRSVSKDTYSLN